MNTQISQEIGADRKQENPTRRLPVFWKPRVRPSVARGLAALVLLMGGMGIFASTAHADVNTTTNNYAVAHISNCTVYIGDEASPYRYAIGDTTVSCASYHNIAVHTMLYRNDVLAAMSATPYSYFPDVAYVHDVPTAALKCGGNASWYTVSYVSIDGSAWQGWYGVTESFAPGC